MTPICLRDTFEIAMAKKTTLLRLQEEDVKDLERLKKLLTPTNGKLTRVGVARIALRRLINQLSENK